MPPFAPFEEKHARVLLQIAKDTLDKLPGDAQTDGIAKATFSTYVDYL